MKLIFYKPVLLATMLATAFSASAYDFEHEGIFYDVTSTADLTCEVVNKKLTMVKSMSIRMQAISKSPLMLSFATKS